MNRKTIGLESAPGVGPSIAADLRRLGIGSLAALGKSDPEKLYEDLCRLEGHHVDRCVLYVFRCAVYFSSRGKNPEKLKWWNWKDVPENGRLAG